MIRYLNKFYDWRRAWRPEPAAKTQRDRKWPEIIFLQSSVPMSSSHGPYPKVSRTSQNRITHEPVGEMPDLNQNDDQSWAGRTGKWPPTRLVGYFFLGSFSEGNWVMRVPPVSWPQMLKVWCSHFWLVWHGHHHHHMTIMQNRALVFISGYLSLESWQWNKENSVADS